MSSLRLYSLGTEPEVRFALRELRRCLAAMTGSVPPAACRRRFDPAVPGLWLGRFDQVGEALPAGTSATADDSILVRVGSTGGVVAGSNGRSVLLAVYRLLAELGCRWVRPGRDGEWLPRLAGPLPDITLRETAAHRHRGVCIEGAVAYGHVRDMVDWLPKLGFNAYFIQFREACTFFQRWYQHEANPRLRRQPFSVERARRLTQRLRAEVKKRGLLLHMVGHGWTCEPFGIPGPGWYPHVGPIPEAAVLHLAQVNGQRGLWQGIALNTNLCYGNPETRAIVSAAIAAYAGHNPDIDLIHVWLADGSNNQCECPLCTGQRPADHYVALLNEVDAALTRAGLPTRIVFLAYVDLLWPPEHEILRNPGRFVLMFAPITRSYSTSFTAAARTAAPAPDLPPYVRNRLQFPRDPAGNVAFLAAWQRLFAGDSFDFDYHFMWDHYKDPGQYAMARVLHDDVRGLRDIGLAGLVSCQAQRVFFPTGLGMTVMGRTLWNPGLTFAEIAADYLCALAGSATAASAVGEYLAALSCLFSPRLLRGEGTDDDRRVAADRLARVPEVVEALAARVQAGLGDSEPVRRRSWRLLQLHGEYCDRLSVALGHHFGGRAAEARRAALDLAEWVRRAEPELGNTFDVFEFLNTMAPLLGLTHQDVLGR